MSNPLLASFENQPAMIIRGAEQRFESFLEHASATLAKIEDVAAMGQPVMGDDFWFSSDDWRASFRPYNVKDGILIIPVRGVLLHGMGYQLGNYATGYVYLTKALERGLADPAVRGIAWVHDSPGGHVAGNFELADLIYEARSVKPQRAYAFEMACSASYSLASAAESLTVSRSGSVGSIGVLRVHYDYSKMLADIGIKTTFTHFGKHKVDGNSSEPLPKDVQERWQAQIDELGEEFVSIVARNRGMDVKAVRDTEALVFTAKEATSNGLADQIGVLDDALAAFAAESTTEKDNTMTTQDKAATFDQAAIDAARAEGFAAGKAEGHKDGVKAEKDRRNAILGSDAAKERPIAANAAVETNMSAEDAIAFLGNLPAEKATASDDSQADGANSNFQRAMDSASHPNIGAGSEETHTLSRAEQALIDAGYTRKAS